MRLRKVVGDKNPADFLTKFADQNVHDFCCQAVGLADQRARSDLVRGPLSEIASPRGRSIHVRCLLPTCLASLKNCRCLCRDERGDIARYRVSLS